METVTETVTKTEDTAKSCREQVEEKLQETQTAAEEKITEVVEQAEQAVIEEVEQMKEVKTSVSEDFMDEVENKVRLFSDKYLVVIKKHWASVY